MPLEHSGRLAAHTVDEAKRYAANSSYEADAAWAPIKLVGVLCCGRQWGPWQTLLLLLQGTRTNPVRWLPQTLETTPKNPQN